MPKTAEGPVFITLGNNTLFGINANGQFVIRKEDRGRVVTEIELGYASESRLNMLQLHIGSLRIHTERS